jgi:DNA replication and repair protein RecF
MTCASVKFSGSRPPNPSRRHGMRLKLIALENFRNIESLRTPLPHSRLAIIGPNAQGKSNFLEAVSLLSHLRSFRTKNSRQLIRENQSEGRVLWQIEHETEGDLEIILSLKGARKSVRLNDRGVQRLADFVGRFPVVTCCQEDRLLLRGAPALRRSFIDGFICGLSPDYFRHLSRFQEALQLRNAALKKEETPSQLYVSYEAAMAEHAAALIAARAVESKTLEAQLRDTYLSFSDADEEPCLTYRPHQSSEDAGYWKELWARERPRDQIMQSTRHGPHRDDWELILRGRDAGDFGSDGQQRGLVVALRLSEARIWEVRTGTRPVLLFDDVLNELDQRRREAFWNFVPPEQQVIATGTRPPEGEGWHYWTVQKGIFQLG